MTARWRETINLEDLWEGDMTAVAVDGAENKDAAWYYPEPLPAAAQIKNFIAFWRGVQVER